MHSPHAGSRRTSLPPAWRPLAALVLATAAVLAATASAAHAQEPTETTNASDERTIIVAQVEGLIDDVVADFLAEQLTEADRTGAEALVLQLNSGGAAVADEGVAHLVRQFRSTETPLGVWVGPSGSQVAGTATYLLSAAPFVGVSPGSTVGPLEVLPGVAQPAGLSTDAALSAQGAFEEGLATVAPEVAPTVGEFVLAMADGGLISKVWKDVESEDGRVLRTIADGVVLQFTSPSVVDGLFHTAASPAVAYLLLLVALSMVLLDFFTGGVGVAGAVGAVSLLLSAYGMSVLGVNPLALAVLVAGFVAFAVDLQTGVPRFWTVVGCVAVLVGSLWLFDGRSAGPFALVVGLVLTGIYVLSGLPALIRTRYGTSTLGREWMVGEQALAVTDVNPEGTVELAGGTWPARVNRLTPLTAGQPARVSGLDGVVLQVEPLEGAAVDYREMRHKRASAAGGGGEPAESSADESPIEESAEPTKGQQAKQAEDGSPAG